jgi:hypothetical protein
MVLAGTFCGAALQQICQAIHEMKATKQTQDAY